MLGSRYGKYRVLPTSEHFKKYVLEDWLAFYTQPFRLELIVVWDESQQVSVWGYTHASE